MKSLILSFSLMFILSGCTGLEISSEFDGCNDVPLSDKEFCVDGKVTVGDKE